MRISDILSSLFKQILPQFLKKKGILIEEKGKLQPPEENYVRSLQQRIQQLEGLSSTIATTSNVLEMGALIRSTLDQMLQILEIPAGVIWINTHMVIRGMSEEAGHTFKQAVCEQELSLHRKIAVPDWKGEARPPFSTLKHTAQALGLRATVILPIFCSGKIAGIIGLSDIKRREWVTDETALLEIIAHQIGLTAERAQFIQDIQTQNDLMKSLVAQSERLNRTYTPTNVIEAVGRGALELCRADRLAILVYKPHNSFSCLWSYHLSSPFIDYLTAPGADPLSDFISTDPQVFENLYLIKPDHPFLKKVMEESCVSLFIWPLIYEGQATTYVFCFYEKEMRLKPNEHEVMEAFFRQAAAAFENARLFEAERSQRQLAVALREVTARLASTLNLDEVLDSILDQLNRVIPHDASDIMLLENDTVRVLRCRGYPKEFQEQVSKFMCPVSEMRNMVQMSESMRSLVIPDVSKNTEWAVFEAAQWIRSYLGAPIIHRGMILGFINVNSRQTNFFAPESGSILEIFASQVAIFIENARLYQHTQRRIAETDALFRAMLPLLNTNEDVIALAHQITESVTQEFASAHCSVMLIDENRTNLVMAAQNGYLQPGKPILALDGPGLTVQAVKSGHVIYAPDVRRNPRFVQGAPETRSELVIPLSGRDDIIGVLNLESPEINAFDERAQQVLSSYAERAALGLENARLFQTIRRHAEQMIQLNDITRTSLQTLESNAMLDLLTRQIACMINADGCYIFLWNERDSTPLQMNAYGPNQNIYPQIMLADGETDLTESAIRLNRTLIVEDIFNTPYLSPRLAPAFPVQSLMVLPLVSDEKHIGVVQVGFIDSHVFTSEEITLGEQAAGLVALALTRLRSLELAQRRAHEAETLRKASLALTSSLELQQVLNSILTHIEQVLPYESACVFLIDGDYLKVGAVKNLDVPGNIYQLRFTREDDLSVEIQKTLRPVILTDAQADPRYKRWGDTDYVRGWLGVPLVADQDLLGILTLDRREANSFSPDEVELALGFANHAAIAIQNATLHSAVQHLAITDPLTGVYNRRGFFELAIKIMASALRSKHPLSILMIDIDFFKKVNDQYGHDEGDVVLQEVTARCNQILREGDLICRYGGEEFTILLPDSDLTGAYRAAQRLYAHIVHEPIEGRSAKISITISIGIATLSEDCTSLEALLKRADLALYSAKQKGRNRICTWNAQTDAPA